MLLEEIDLDLTSHGAKNKMLPLANLGLAADIKLVARRDISVSTLSQNQRRGEP